VKEIKESEIDTLVFYMLTKRLLQGQQEAREMERCTRMKEKEKKKKKRKRKGKQQIKLI
tara:strand:+ start:955 stop:1131 length:177 start_codon:yes stop_codon:yes gene_type:complete